MAESTRKEELLERIRATHEPLEALLASLPEGRMTQPGVNGEWSAKDTLAHLTWWEQHTLRRLRTGREELDQEGEDPGAATDRTNAEVFAANRGRPLAEVLAEFHTSYRELVAALEGASEETLAEDDLYETIAWDTFRHYPGHMAALRAWLDAGAGGSA